VRLIKRRPEKFWQAVGHAIRESRKAHNLTITQVAERMGCSKSMICQVEHAQNRMTADGLFDLLGFLRLDINRILKARLPRTCPRCRGRGTL
jgi:transcriptional regulator with XRE-family HTH domain